MEYTRDSTRYKTRDLLDILKVIWNSLDIKLKLKI